MPITLHLILSACYLVAALVAGLIMPALSAHLSPAGAALGGALVAFLACAVGHLLVLRLIERDTAQRLLAEERGAARLATREAEDLRARLGAIQSGLDAATRRDTSDLMAGMQALRADLALFALSREAATPAPEKAMIPKDSPPSVFTAPRPDDHALFEAVRGAIADNRLDLHAREIVQLPDQHIHLLEVVGEVKDLRGELLAAEDYLPAAARAGKAGPLSNLLLFRSLQVLRQLRRTSTLPPALLRIAPHSLRDGDFFPQFIDFMEHNPDLSQGVVFALAEADFADLQQSSNPGLARLAAIGFTFSLDGITRLDHDAELLGALNVRFVRLAASDLFDDAEAAGALASRLEAAGIALIVDDVEDAATEAVLLENGIRFGGGPLYGSPRPALELAL